MFIADPDAPRYAVYGLLNHTPLNSYSLLLAGCSCFEYCVMVLLWHTGLLNITILFSHWYSTSYWLDHLNSKKSEINGQNTRIENSLRLYRTLQVLESLFTDAISGFTLPWIHFLLVLISAISNYILIRAQDHLPFLPTMALISVTISVFGVVLCAFPIAASIQSNSIQYIRGLSKTNSLGFLSLALKKGIRAARPLRVQVGQIFIRKETVLKLIHIMVYWTARSLLLFK